MSLLVSVIIPVYKVEDYLDRCIQSIIDQTYKKLEIILVDDGSPDGCPQKCDAWEANDGRIRVLHKENAGPGMARNTGLDAASGAYITFVDADDYLASDAIETMVNIIERDGSDLVVAQKVKVYDDGHEEPSAYTWIHNTVLNKDAAFRMIGSDSRPFPASLWARLYKRHIFDHLRFCRLKTGEDTYILPHIVECCDSISFTDSVVYYYYQRETSIVHTMSREKILDNVRSVLHVARELYDRGYISGAKVYYYSAVLHNLRLKRDKDAVQLINDAFTCAEQKVLNKGMNIKTRFSMLMAKYPVIQKLYTYFRL